MVSINPIVSDNRFWLLVMRDNAKLILIALSYPQSNEKTSAAAFISLFDGLLSKARKDLSEDQLNQLNRDAQQAAWDFRRLILQILHQQLTGNLLIFLSSTVLNNMVNQAEEYIYILTNYMNNKKSDISPVRLSLLWLLSAFGNSQSIADNVDITYRNVRMDASRFADDFNVLNTRALVSEGLLRTGLVNFPALEQLYIDAANETQLFQVFISGLKELLLENKILGSLTPVFLDQISRENCYYVTQLSKVSTVSPPECDPAGETEIWRE